MDERVIEKPLRLSGPEDNELAVLDQNVFTDGRSEGLGRCSE
jgi:hypothetical protein